MVSASIDRGGGVRRIAFACGTFATSREPESMHRFIAFYRVPVVLRLLTAVAALATFLSLPLLLRTGSWPLAVPVAVAGVFSASIALFGRSPREADHG
ncbi:MAG: hypothetical protein J7507_00685 [Pseudoxanthomonas sp.]|nr:hypothetical protein [Pseudoxanthomonas sp.]